MNENKSFKYNIDVLVKYYVAFSLFLIVPSIINVMFILPLTLCIISALVHNRYYHYYVKHPNELESVTENDLTHKILLEVIAIFCLIIVAAIGCYILNLEV